MASFGKFRFLTLIKPVLHILPEVAPPDRKIPFKVSAQHAHAQRPRRGRRRQRRKGGGKAGDTEKRREREREGGRERETGREKGSLGSRQRSSTRLRQAPPLLCRVRVPALDSRFHLLRESAADALCTQSCRIPKLCGAGLARHRAAGFV
eukprot:scaffold28305_cov27-Tisochrysis_lutea.AAC.1